MQVGDPRCAEGNGGGEKKEKRRRKAGGRGMCDELVEGTLDERWRVCVVLQWGICMEFLETAMAVIAYALGEDR